MKIQDAVYEDRKMRRGMGRREYSQLVSLTENRVHGIEHGRKLKPGEIEALTPYIGDLLGENVQTQRPVGSMGKVPLEELPPSVNYGADDYIAERRGLEAEYLTVMNRLRGLDAPPIAWPSRYRIETAPPSEFPDIRDWIKKVHEWIDGQLGSQDLFEDETPNLDPTVLPRLPDPDDEEDDDDEDRYSSWSVAHPNSTASNATNVKITVAQPVSTGEVEPRYVTNGELRTWKDCRRRWYLGNYRKLGKPLPDITGAAPVGTRYHEALAAWYQPEPGDPWATFEATTAEGLDLVDDNDRDAFIKETDLVRAMIEGYFQWVESTGVDRGLTVIGSEETVIANPQFPEYPNARLLGRLDVKVFREWDVTRWFLDHKSVGDLTNPVKTLHMDEQMLQYHLIERLAEDEGGYAAGALYNMARKVKRTAGANPPFYAREEVRFNRQFIESYWMRTQQVLGEIEMTTAALDAGADHRAVAYPRPTRDCSWKCDYFLVCPMFDDGSRAEDFLADHFVTINPLERYKDALPERTT